MLRKIVVYDPSGFLTDSVPDTDQFDADGARITNVGAPEAALDATPKAYVDYQFLLDCEPNGQNITYQPTYVGRLVAREAWTATVGGALIRSVDYTYAGPRVAQEVRKVYDPTGVTVVAQLTLLYTYGAGRLVSATETRDV